MPKSVISVVLVGCMLWQTAYAVAGPEAEGEPSRPEGEVIILSDEIGP